MSSKFLQRWTEVNNSSVRLNSRLSSNKQKSPVKYSPKRDKSNSHEKIFNKSRQNFSMSQIKGINAMQSRFRINSSRQKQLQTSGQMPLRLPTLSMKGQSSKLYSTYENQFQSIKKQYLTFKQHVISELQKQKEFVNKMIRQILCTVQSEIQKISEKITSSNSFSEIINKQVSKSPLLENMSNIKQNLSNMISVPSCSNINQEILPIVSPQKQIITQPTRNNPEKQARIEQGKINPSTFELKYYSSAMEDMKRKVEQMDEILIETSQIKRDE